MLAFPGTGNADDLAFVLENAIPYWSSRVWFSIIPFARVADDVFFRTFETTLVEMIAIASLGPKRLSFTYWEDAFEISSVIMNLFEKEPSVRTYLKQRNNRSDHSFSGIVGYGAYGLLAKGLSGKKRTRGYSFNSLQFAHSPVSIFRRWDMGENESAEGPIEHFRSEQMLQVFTDDSLPMSDWHIIPTNSPFLEHFFQTPRTKEMFCRIVAGCATTNRYDSLCDNLLGSTSDRQKMFEDWHRTNRSTRDLDGQGKKFESYPWNPDAI
jgi:hypothetical protein